LSPEFVLDQSGLRPVRSNAQEEAVAVAKEPVSSGTVGLGSVTGSGGQLGHGGSLGGKLGGTLGGIPVAEFGYLSRIGLTITVATR